MRHGETLSQLSETRPMESLPARYEALFRVSRAIDVYRDPRELFRVLARELVQIVDFDFVAIFLYDEGKNKIQNAILESLGNPGFDIPPDFPAEETITRWVYQHQETVLISSRDEEVRFPRMMELFQRHGVESACILPLTTVYRRLGSLSFGARHPGPILPRRFVISLWSRTRSRWRLTMPCARTKREARRRTSKNCSN